MMIVGKTDVCGKKGIEIVLLLFVEWWNSLPFDTILYLLPLLALCHNVARHHNQAKFAQFRTRMTLRTFNQFMTQNYHLEYLKSYNNECPHTFIKTPKVS